MEEYEDLIGTYSIDDSIPGYNEYVELYPQNYPDKEYRIAADSYVRYEEDGVALTPELWENYENVPNGGTSLYTSENALVEYEVNIEESGFLRFKTVGGIDTAALMFRRVLVNGKTLGVIGGKPVHLCEGAERKKLPDADSLYIDIGVRDKAAAEALVSLGDFGTFDTEFLTFGENDAYISGKALDDRVGCWVLLEAL